MYRTATFLVEHFWGRPAEMADSVGVLLLTWNNAFYRYGLFDFYALEACIETSMERLTAYRGRDILSWDADDDTPVRELFDEFLIALRICEGKKAGVCSPVGVAKALHMLAPRFFPLWDDKIAKAYGCYYAHEASGKYVLFCDRTRLMAEELIQAGFRPQSSKTILKLIDEYNYARYTKGWV